MNKKGFTLVELLAVIVILGLIALIAIPSVSTIITNSKEKALELDAKTFLLELEKYIALHDNDPDKYPLKTEIENKTVQISALDLNSTFIKKIPNSGTIIFDKNGEIKSSKLTYGTKNLSCSSVDQCEIKSCEYDSGQSWAFDYVTENSDKEQNFTVPCDGNYKLEVWGAQGGSYNTTYIGGYGGYSYELKDLLKDNLLYINVGGVGIGGTSRVLKAGGYNGGGDGKILNSDNNQRQSSGGGATHIATTSGLLKDLSPSKDKILIVAGGGGAGGGNAAVKGVSGGSGGGSAGVSGMEYIEGSANYGSGTGGTQTEGGTPFSTRSGGTYASGLFGLGGSTNAGGGGGYYGGGCGPFSCGGGSSYLNSTLKKETYCYKCTEDSLTKSVETYSNDAKEKTPKSGNGYAKITYMG